MKRRAAAKRRRLLKARGLLTCCALLGCLFMGLLSGTREFFLLTILLLVWLLLAFVQATLQRPQFRLDLDTGQVERGQALSFRLLARNPHPWPIYPLRLRFSLCREGQPPLPLTRQEILLRGRQEQILELTAVCPHSGEYQVLLERYYAEDVFGFFALPGLALPPQSLISLPRLNFPPVAMQQQAAREEEEIAQSRQGRQGQLIAESRPFQEGDSLRSIHWKKSASRHTLFSRLREHSTDDDCRLLLDRRPYGQGEEALEYEDRLREAALGFLFSHLSKNQAITLLPGALTLQAPQSAIKAAALLASLPFAADTTELDLQLLLESQPLPDTLYLVLAQSPQSLLPSLEQLTSQGCRVVGIIPTADRQRLESELTLPLSLISIDPPEVSYGSDKNAAQA